MLPRNRHSERRRRHADRRRHRQPQAGLPHPRRRPGRSRRPGQGGRRERPDDLVVDLAEHAPRLFDWADAELTRLTAEVAAADIAIFASPTYKAAYTGMLKAFLDRYGSNGLAGIVAVPVMTGGWPGHLLAVEVHLRPVLVELGATVPARGLYVTEPELATWTPPSPSGQKPPSRSSAVPWVLTPPAPPHTSPSRPYSIPFSLLPSPPPSTRLIPLFPPPPLPPPPSPPLPPGKASRCSKPP